MTWRSQERATGRLPIVAATLLSTALLCSEALAQGSPDVVVNYDVLNSLSAQPAAPSAPNPAAQPSSRYVPGYGPGYPAPPPYGANGTAMLPPPPPGTLSSVLTTLGPDGRPMAPIKLKKPGSQPGTAQGEASAAPSDAEIAAATPPPEPATLPDTVPMPAPTPAPPAPGVTAEAAPVGAAPAATVVQAPAAAPPEPQTTQQASPEPEVAQQRTPEPAPQQASAEQPAAPTQPSAVQEEPVQQEAAKAPVEPTEAPATQDGSGEGQPPEEAAAPPPEPENSQPAAPVPQGGIRIVYPVDLNDVPAEADAALDDLASQMQADESMRIQIKCYASGTADTESKARRKSLARCISIRQYLFKKDIRTTRMDVRALGLKSEGQPADRVDIVPATS